MRSLLVLLMITAAALGCGPAEEPGAKKEDFEKKPMPENWRGPGNAGAPSGPPK